jgi:hypothetical protein
LSQILGGLHHAQKVSSVHVLTTNNSTELMVGQRRLLAAFQRRNELGFVDLIALGIHGGRQVRLRGCRSDTAGENGLAFRRRMVGEESASVQAIMSWNAAFTEGVPDVAGDR